jgi:hypothetical protein
MPILGVIASSISGNLYNASYESIATFTTTGSAQGVTFSSIPQTYTHLQIRCFTRCQAAAPNPDYLLTQINGVTTAQYSNHAIYGNGTTATADAFNVSSFGFCGPLSYVSGAYSTANIFSPIVVDFLDYTNTNKFKTIRGLGGFDSAGSGTVGLFSGSWRSTAAINSIYISTANNNEVAGSVYALYGIKGVA